MRHGAVLALLLLGACDGAPDPADPRLAGVENAYKSGLMATVCHAPREATDPFLAAELRRRDELVREAEAKGLGPAFKTWREEWKALAAVADVACFDKGGMADQLREWNVRLAAALREYR